MKHLRKFKIFENTEEKTYIFTPDENLLKMVKDYSQFWGKLADNHEMEIMSLTGDRSNVQYFPFTGNEECIKKEAEILDAAVKGGYKPTSELKKQPNGYYKDEDWKNFTKAIAPSLKK